MGASIVTRSAAPAGSLTDAGMGAGIAGPPSARGAAAGSARCRTTRMRAPPPPPSRPAPPERGAPPPPPERAEAVLPRNPPQLFQGGARPAPRRRLALALGARH